MKTWLIYTSRCGLDKYLEEVDAVMIKITLQTISVTIADDCTVSYPNMKVFVDELRAREYFTSETETPY